jgi:uncharacterized protein (UPF0332 family)
MGFAWIDFLEIARELIDKAGSTVPKEAANRSAVSRAYYAAFCTVRNYAEAHLGFQRVATAQVHELLRRHLIEQGGAWIAIARKLNQLRQWRNQCDYDDIVFDIERTALQALERALSVIRQCQQQED